MNEFVAVKEVDLEEMGDKLVENLSVRSYLLLYYFRMKYHL